jgi:hypothetical protein
MISRYHLMVVDSWPESGLCDLVPSEIRQAPAIRLHRRAQPRSHTSKPYVRYHRFGGSPFRARQVVLQRCRGLTRLVTHPFRIQSPSARSAVRIRRLASLRRVIEDLLFDRHGFADGSLSHTKIRPIRPTMPSVCRATQFCRKATLGLQSCQMTVWYNLRWRFGSEREQ